VTTDRHPTVRPEGHQVFVSLPHENLTADEADDLADRLRKAAQAARITVELLDPCTYSQSHTRDWCGHPGCRES
jgi:hypothetical protein